MVTATHQLCQTHVSSSIKWLYTFTFRRFCNKESTQTSNNNLCWNAPTIFTACTVSHMFASLRSCSILSLSFLSSSFLRASSAYHVVEIYGEQDNLMRTRDHWLTRKIPSASTNAKMQSIYPVERKGISLTPDIKIWRKFWKCKNSKQFTGDLERAISAMVTATQQMCRTHVSSSINWLHTFTLRCSCNKESTQTSKNNFGWKARTTFTAYTVSHTLASLRSCSNLSSSFLRASSAYHAVEFSWWAGLADANTTTIGRELCSNLKLHYLNLEAVYSQSINAV